MNAAIGQGDVLVTPLQLANAYATFANHGTVLPAPGGAAGSSSPTATRRKPADVRRSMVKPVVTGHVDLPPTMYDPILSGLQGVREPTRRARPTPPSRAST